MEFNLTKINYVEGIYGHYVVLHINGIPLCYNNGIPLCHIMEFCYIILTIFHYINLEVDLQNPWSDNGPDRVPVLYILGKPQNLGATVLVGYPFCTCCHWVLPSF